MALPFAAIPAGFQVASGLMSMFGSNKGAKQAQQHLQQVGNMGREYYDPYIQQGQQAWKGLEPIYGQMSQNPNDFLSSIFSNYQQSPGFQRQQQNALQAGNNSAAAGGFAGTNQHRSDQMDLAQALQGQDMQQFLQNILGIQGSGMSGLENANTRGFEGARSLTDLLANVGGSRASLSYQNGANNRNNQMFGMSQIGGGLGRMGGSMNWQNLGDMFR